MVASEQTTGECNSSLAQDAVCRTTELVKENPGLSMLVVFGVGVGIGAILGELVPMGGSSRHIETTAERIGRQICDALHIKL